MTADNCSSAGAQMVRGLGLSLGKKRLHAMSKLIQVEGR